MTMQPSREIFYRKSKPTKDDGLFDRPTSKAGSNFKTRALDAGVVDRLYVPGAPASRRL